MTHPLALDRWPEIAARLAGRPLALFLDYDGTLSPIAPRPELATLPAAAREVIERLALRMPTAVLSGRGLADVATMVGLPQLHYGGSHGFDIVGPRSDGAAGAGGAEGTGTEGAAGAALRHEVGEGVPARVEQAAERLRHDLADVEGALVEPKRFSLAVHYRRVDDHHLPRLEAAVERAGAASGLRKTGGKKVFELRPEIDWDKGKALLWLLDRWDGSRPPAGTPAAASTASGASRPSGAATAGSRRLPIYLGDDVTDEDAFAVLAARGGIGFLVAEEPRASAADYRLRDPGEVVELLRRLADLPPAGAGK